MAGEQALEFLGGMWTVVEEELEEDQRMGSEGLGLDVYEVGEDVHAAIVTMPAPEREFEARYVALVARFEEPGSFARVFSMVGTEPPAQHSEVALLEWDREGKYSFVEQRCGPTVDDFIDALERVLAKPSD